MMTDTTMIDQVRAHYTPDGLIDRLRSALMALGPADAILQPAQLAALDHFHTRGALATMDLARLAGIQARDHVLDLGAGIGGPARMLASAFGCRVTGVDLSPEFVAAARYLSKRTGQQDQLAFHVGDARDTGLAAASFDVVLLQHVAMNIADRAALYREIRRLLPPGGRFATYDIVSAVGAPDYPVPWARSAATSFLLSAEATQAAIEQAGFRIRHWQDDSPAAIAFFNTLANTPPVSEPNLAVVMGADFGVLTGNLARAIADQRVGVLAAVAEAV